MRVFLACAFLACSVSCPQPELSPHCALTLEIVEEGTGRPLPGLVRAEGAGGAAVPLEGLLPRGYGVARTGARNPAELNLWWTLPGRQTVRVPRERLRLFGFSGLETTLGAVELDLTGKDRAEARLPVRRFYELSGRGYRSGNTHLHLQKASRSEADRYLREIPRADGLDLVFLSYLERAEADREYISNRYTAEDLKDLSSSGVLFSNGEEHRHNFTGFGQGYGHVMFLNLPRLVRPVSVGPGIMKAGTDAPPLRRGIDQARSDGATVVWCHNRFGVEDVPNWVTGRVHAQNIFDGDPDAHGSYDETFYRYLNAGLRVPFSTGTDWFIYDFSRVHVQMAELRSSEDWLRGLRAGRSYITNGPFLEFEVGGRPVGDTVRLASPGRVKVTARAKGRVDFRRLEVVQNGTVILTAPARAERGFAAAEVEAEVDVAGPSWFALRTPPPPGKESPATAADAFPKSELGWSLFSHTSPVYVEVAGRAVFQPEAARALLEEVKAGRDVIGKTALFADEHERGHVMLVYADGIRALEKILGQGEPQKKSYVFKEAGPVKIELDVYRPPRPGRVPVLVWIHGGALLMGSRTGVPSHLLELCKAEGFALVSIDYRLAPQVKLPDVVADVKDALGWVTGRGAEAAGLDPGKVVVAGGSAGGYLTLMSGLAADPKPRALVAFWGYGDVDGDWYTKPSAFYRQRPLVPADEARKGLSPDVVTAPPDKAQAEARSRLYLYFRQNGLWTKEVTGFDHVQERAKLDPYCPVRNVGASYPPTLLIHGTEDTDVPYDLSAAMAKELERHKVEHELVTVEGAGHGLSGVDRKRVAEANARAHAFIRKHLRRD